MSTSASTPAAHHVALQVIDFGDRRVEYVAAGSGPAVVMIHGSNCSADDWSDVVPHLTAGYRVIVPDGLVHAHDPWLIWCLLDHLGIDDAVLAGHSSGGMVARAMYRLQPQRVRAMVMADSQGAGPLIRAWRLPHERFSPPAARMYEQHRSLMAQLAEHHRDDYPSMVNIEKRLRGLRRARMSAGELAQTRPGPAAVAHAGAPPPAPEPIPEDGKYMTCPVLICLAGRGKVGQEDFTAEWLDPLLAADVELTVTREAGHWCWLDQPEWFLSHLEPFLARTRGAAA